MQEILYLSHNIKSGGDITACNKIYKPLWFTYTVLMLYNDGYNNVMYVCLNLELCIPKYSKESNIYAHVLLNLLNLMCKSNKMLSKPHNLSVFLNLLIKSIIDTG